MGEEAFLPCINREFDCFEHRSYRDTSIGHFTVVCLVSWRMNTSEGVGDIA